MKINYIKYHNYRCFSDVTVRFDTTKDKDISLVLGVNGAGKTEMLFSFQWVLYGFDFASLREKEGTPYSLNSIAYRELEYGEGAKSATCWVELAFLHNGLEYFVKRSERFVKSGGRISSTVNVELSHTKPTGERTTPIRDPKEVDELLSRIIPKSILEGITFDGERMKKLNILGNEASGTIKNVISLVTNETLFEICLREVIGLKKEKNTEIQKITKQSGDTSTEELAKRIEDLEGDIEDSEISLASIKTNIEDKNNRLQINSQKLSELKEAKELEAQRKGYEKDLVTYKKYYDQSVEALYRKLSIEGYLLVTDKLMDDVRQSIDNVDVPAGLTVEAVKSILQRPKCICGCEMNDVIVKRLTELISTLPPDNISSTLRYMTEQFEIDGRKSLESLKGLYAEMKARDKKIDEIKSELAKISVELKSKETNRIRETEQERETLIKDLGRLQADEERITNNLARYRKELKELNDQLDDASEDNEHLVELNGQSHVLDLYKKAIELIRERNREQSLSSINQYLSEAYSHLSEDNGRRIYLCQFGRNKYNLVVYFKKEFDNCHEKWMRSGQIKTWQDDGVSEQEITEKIIYNVKEGNSTGQSKINSLAFAKAILDYSNEDRAGDELKTSHDYPFLIDSPFTELSGENPANVAKCISQFASQIIMMVDNMTYATVCDDVEPYVNSKTELIKNLTEGITTTK